MPFAATPGGAGGGIDRLMEDPRTRANALGRPRYRAGNRALRVFVNAWKRSWAPACVAGPRWEGREASPPEFLAGCPVISSRMGMFLRFDPAHHLLRCLSREPPR